MRFRRLIFLGLVVLQSACSAGPSAPVSYVSKDVVGPSLEPWRIEAAVWDEINSHPNVSNAELRRGCGMQTAAWDAKLMYAYVYLISALTETEGLKLAKEQVEWEKKRNDRSSPYLNRNEFGAEGVLDYAETYCDFTRWRIARLEERLDEIAQPSGAAAKQQISPAQLFPVEMGWGLEPDKVYERIRESKKGDVADGLSDEGWRMMKSVWNAQLLSTYIAVLRTLTPEAGRALADEQTKWFSKRYEDEEKKPDWENWKKVTRARVAELEARVPKDPEPKSEGVELPKGG